MVGVVVAIGDLSWSSVAVFTLAVGFAAGIPFRCFVRLRGWAKGYGGSRMVRIKVKQTIGLRPNKIV